MDELNCSRSTINNRILAGHLRPVRRGKKIYFNPDEVLKLSENLKTERLYKKAPGVIPKTKRRDLEGMPVSGRQRPSGTESYAGYEASVVGKLSAAAVRLYDTGKNIRDVVLQLEISFEMASHFYEQWKMTGSEWHVPYRSLLYLRGRFAWDEEDPTPEGLLAAINDHVKDLMKKTTMNNYDAPEADTGIAQEGSRET